MIAAILILAAGILLAGLPVLLRKRLGRSWKISLLITGVLIAVLGGIFTYQQWDQKQQRLESIYLGLQYLERYEIDSCAYYLKRAGSDSYESVAARSLLELVRGNELSARLNLDTAKVAAKSQEKLTFLDTLRNVDTNDPEQMSVVVGRIIKFLKLSAKRTTRLDAYIQVESGYGYDVENAGLDEDMADRLHISAMLKSGSYEQAVFTAARLSDRSPSADNRLLLAEAVAESAYENVVLTSTSFVPEQGDPSSSEPWEDPTIEKERQKLLEQSAKLENELLELNIAASGGETEETNQKRLELTEEIRALQNRADKLYVYRAFNAIADLHSTKADLMRARLYFALQEYDQAVNTIQSAAKSLSTILSADREMTNSLRIVSQAYQEDTAFHESQEFQDAVVYLLSAPFPNLMYLSQTSLTQDFTQHIVSDLKVYGQSLFATQVDITQFPTVQVTLSGREELLKKIVEQTETQVRDTRQSVQYTAWIHELALSNVCVVVDRSGSMGGSPMENLKSALENFIHNMTPETIVSLVAFDTEAQHLTELTQDQALLLTQVGMLNGDGGTNITSGIQSGIGALEGSVGARVMLLMTDGQSDIDFTVVEEAVAAGITIHAIGFGDVNDALLQQIAEQTGGQYIKADSSAELNNVYASLQRVIGHVITLEYTAPAPEIVMQRYFFLNVDGYSIHIDYSLVQETQQAELYFCSPSVVTPDEIERARQQSWNLTLRLTGERLSGAASVTVGGQTAQIEEQRNDQLTLTVAPVLTPGWQTVVLTMKDGTQRSFDRLLLVGETAYFPQLRLGSLTIQRSQGVLPGDGTLVLTDNRIRLQENVSQEGSSLSLYLTGTLTLPVTPELVEKMQNAAYSDEVSLGSQGSISGWGIVSVDSGDGAYSSNAPNVVAKGSLGFECLPAQSKLIQNAEGGN